MRDVAALAALIDDVDWELGRDRDREPEPAVAFGARGGPPDHDETELMIRVLTGHPRDALECFVAPDDWWAFGVVAHGWMSAAKPWDDIDQVSGRMSGVAPSRWFDRERIRTISVVDRDGRWASRNVRETGAAFDSTEAPIGFVPDTMLRVMGLPTPAPPPSPAELYASMWLGRIAADDDPVALSWAEVRALHPGATAGDDLVHAAGQLAGECGWRWLRDAARRGVLTGSVDADVASWMDEGMLARALLSRYPPVAQALDVVSGLVSSGVARRIRAVLER